MKYLAIIAVISFCAISAQGQEFPPEFPECDPSVVTWHPHPFTCTRYILCYHGYPVERLCAPGLHFGRITEQCMFPQLAMCDINYACPAEDDRTNPVFLPDPDDCSQYFVCFEGSPIPRGCAANLWWDTVYNWCTIADEVNCDSRVPNDPRPPVTETPATTTPLPTTTPTTPPPTTTPTTPPPTTTQTTTTQNPNTYDCPLSSEPSFHPHSRECELYFICINGVAFLRECAAGMIFDILQLACDEIERATCISGAVIGGPDLNNESKSTKMECPTSTYDFLLFPHQTRCGNYYMCEKGVAYLRSCPRGKFYDVYLQNCEDDAVCFNDL